MCFMYRIVHKVEQIYVTLSLTKSFDFISNLQINPERNAEEIVVVVCNVDYVRTVELQRQNQSYNIYLWEQGLEVWPQTRQASVDPSGVRPAISKWLRAVPRLSTSTQLYISVPTTINFIRTPYKSLNTSQEPQFAQTNNKICTVYSLANHMLSPQCN